MLHLEKLSSLIRETFHLAPDHPLNDEWGPDHIDSWDSLAQLELINRIEEQFKLTFEVEEIFEILTLGDLKRIVLGKLNGS